MLRLLQKNISNMYTHQLVAIVYSKIHLEMIEFIKKKHAVVATNLFGNLKIISK